MPTLLWYDHRLSTGPRIDQWKTYGLRSWPVRNRGIRPRAHQLPPPVRGLTRIGLSLLSAAIVSNLRLGRVPASVAGDASISEFSRSKFGLRGPIMDAPQSPRIGCGRAWGPGCCVLSGIVNVLSLEVGALLS